MTMISHDSETRKHLNGFAAKGSYSGDIDYTGASLFKLAGLTNVSSHSKGSS